MPLETNWREEWNRQGMAGKIVVWSRSVQACDDATKTAATDAEKAAQEAAQAVRTLEKATTVSAALGSVAVPDVTSRLASAKRWAAGARAAADSAQGRKTGVHFFAQRFRQKVTEINRAVSVGDYKTACELARGAGYLEERARAGRAEAELKARQAQDKLAEARYEVQQR